MKNVLHKIFLPFSLVLIVIGITGYSVYQSNIKMIDSSKWVDHTEHVISLTEKVLSLTKDLETGARGYIITKDSDFLEPILTAKNVIFQT